MIRTQIQVSEDQARALRQLAHSQGVSVSAVIRRCIDDLLARQAPDPGALYARVERLTGAARDPEGRTDLATHHDDYVEQSYSPAGKRRRKR